MAKLISTYSKVVAKKEICGKVATLSRQITLNIDRQISESFSINQKKAVIKQGNSIRLLKSKVVNNV